MTPIELLRQLNDLDEHPRIEAKAGSAMGRSILESVCAFANEPGLGGGWLLLGVKADDQAFWKQYEVVGVPNSDQLQADLASQCAATFNVPIRPQIEVAEIQGKRVIAVFVPECPASTKPVFFTATGLPKGAYRRIGSSDVRCTPEDMAVFYGDHASNTMDVALLPDGDLDEIDPDALQEYRRLKGSNNPGAEELQWSDHDLLRALRCADKDSHGVLRPTVAGILLFGKTTGRICHSSPPGSCARPWSMPSCTAPTAFTEPSRSSAIRTASKSAIPAIPSSPKNAGANPARSPAILTSPPSSTK